MKNAKKTALFNIILTFLLVASLALSVVGCDKNTNDTSKDVSNDNSPEVSDVSEPKVLTAEEHYNLAKGLIDEEKYEEAYNHLLECKDYADTNELLQKFVLKYEKVTVYNEKNEFVVENNYKYDKNGNTIYEANVNEDGTIRDKSEDRYDDDGNLIYHSYYNEEGSNFLIYEYEYNEKGDIVLEKYTNENGNGEVRYNERGEILEAKNYDTDGKLESHTENKYKYDEKGEKLLEEELFENGVLTDRTVYIYDGNTVTDVYYNFIDGEAVVYGKTVVTYDDMKNIVSWSHYDKNSKKTYSNESVYEYDAEGRIISQTQYNFGEFEFKEEYTYNDDGSRIALSWNSEKEKPDAKEVYDGKDRLIDYTVYDENGKLETRLIDVFDEYDNLTASTKYDKDGKVIEETRCVNENVCVLYFPDGIEE